MFGKEDEPRHACMLFMLDTAKHIGQWEKSVWSKIHQEWVVYVIILTFFGTLRPILSVKSFNILKVLEGNHCQSSQLCSTKKI